MPRPDDAEHYELSDAEKRDLIALIQAGKPLPDKYRFLLFADRREVELVWNGKTRDVTTAILPFQTLEHIDEPRKEKGADVLAFEFEMGLFPAVLKEAKQKGIDLAPKTIPPEVFDKRAVDKGQVRFHDVAYIEVTPRFDKKDKLTLAIELSDFSVFYTQGILDSVAAELKEGKSDVVCDLRGDRGQLIKVSKDKQGIVTTDVLTKK